MGNAWHVLPLTTDEAQYLEKVEVVPVPSGPAVSSVPTPNQVFAALASFPEYRVAVRRWDHKEKGQFVYIKLLQEDGSIAIIFNLLGVTADDQPAGTFAFEYYRETEELIRLVAKLANVCGPLVLWHDGGCERSIVVSPGQRAEPDAAADGGRDAGSS
jgi:hypothetical protein